MDAKLPLFSKTLRWVFSAVFVLLVANAVYFAFILALLRLTQSDDLSFFCFTVGPLSLLVLNAAFAVGGVYPNYKKTARPWVDELTASLRGKMEEFLRNGARKSKHPKTFAFIQSANFVVVYLMVVLFLNVTAVLLALSAIYVAGYLIMPDCYGRQYPNDACGMAGMYLLITSAPAVIILLLILNGALLVYGIRLIRRIYTISLEKPT